MMNVKGLGRSEGRIWQFLTENKMKQKLRLHIGVHFSVKERTLLTNTFDVREHDFRGNFSPSYSKHISKKNIETGKNVLN